MNHEAVATRRRRLGPDAVLAAYVVLLLVIPSAYTVGSYAITAAMVVGLAAAALWLGGLVLPDRVTAFGSEPARRGVLVYLGLIFVSYLVAMLRPLDDTAADAADRHLVGLLSVVGVSLLAVDGLRDRQALYRVLGVLVAAGGAVALIGILQYVAHFDLARRLRPPGFAVASGSGFVYTRAGFYRVAGTARHPIEFGIVCALLLPIALHMAAHGARAVSRRASLLAAGLIGLALPMALSRSAVLAVAVVLAIMLPGLPTARRWKLIAGVGAVLWSVTLLAPGVLTTVRELFFGGAASGSNEARTQATEAAFDLFADEPWFGHGFGTLQGIIVDNQLLVTIVESGVLGIVGLLALANGSVFALRSARRSTDDEALRDLGLTLIAVVAAVAVGSTGLATLRYPTTSALLFLSIGLAGAVHRIASGEGLVRLPASGGPALVPVRS
jgi:O-antigen ligase